MGLIISPILSEQEKIKIKKSKRTEHGFGYSSAVPSTFTLVNRIKPRNKKRLNRSFGHTCLDTNAICGLMWQGLVASLVVTRIERALHEPDTRVII